MPSDSKKKRYNLRNKKTQEKEKERKKHSDDDGNGADDEVDEEEEFDSSTYKKFLQKLFPSKDLNEKISQEEKQKVFEKMKKSSKPDKKETIYLEEEAFIPYKKCSVSELKGEVKNRGIKGVTTKDKKELIKILEDFDEKMEEEEEEDSEYETEEEDSDDEDDEEEDEELDGQKFNIVFTIGNPNEEEDSESETEDEEDEEEEEEEEEEFEEEEEEEEEEEDSSKDKKSKKDKEKSTKKPVKKDEKYYKSEMDLIDRFSTMAKELMKENKGSDTLKEILDMNKDQKEYLKHSQKKSEKKKRAKNTNKFKKIIKEKGDMNDYTFFKKLSVTEQEKMLVQMESLNKLIKTDKPYRMQLLDADIPDHFKACALKKITALRYIEPGGGEYYKMKNWVDTFMRIPFNSYENIPMTISEGPEKCGEFMESSMKILNDSVYGMDDAKLQIMQMIGTWISNPSATGTAIAIKGPPGTGKTTLVKEGISKILNRPFAFIALGGATDSSYLEGHGYTYEGSMPGKIVDILIQSKCMNPVIYFDEVDKISDTPKGEEIVGVLTHLTDTTQNDAFHDKYFAELDFDLNKCLFIFSYNDDDKVNPILKDRMYKINTKGYEKKEKVVIAEKHLLPKIKEQVRFTEEDLTIPTSCMEYIIEKFSGTESGVRNLKRCLEIVCTKLNLYRLMKPGAKMFNEKETLDIKFPLEVTNEMVDKLLKAPEKNNDFQSRMYL